MIPNNRRSVMPVTVRSNHGGTMPGAARLKLVPKKPAEKPLSAEEEEMMLKFVKDAVEKDSCRLDLPLLWKTYVVYRNSNEPWTYYDKQFRVHMAPKIHQYANLNKEMKVRILFSTGTPVEKNFLVELKDDAYVQVTDDNVIFYYKEKKENGFRLPGTVTKKKPVKKEADSEESDHEHATSTEAKGVMYTKEEEAQMLDFLAETSTNTKTVISMRAMWIAYKKRFKSKRGIKSLHARFRNRLAPTIHLLKGYDNRTKVRMLHSSSTPVDKAFVKKLRKEADLSVDDRGLFVYYREFTHLPKQELEVDEPSECSTSSQAFEEVPSLSMTTTQDTFDYSNIVVKQEMPFYDTEMFGDDQLFPNRPVEEKPFFSADVDMGDIDFFEDLVKGNPLEGFDTEDVKPNIDELRAIWGPSSDSDLSATVKKEETKNDCLFGLH